MSETSVGSAAPAATGQQEARGWVLPLCVLVVGTFMSVLDTSIVNVAVPTIQLDLSAAADDVEWIVTGYTLALGVVVPLTGWLGERIGKTTLYILSMVGFAAASALCGAAWNLDSLIVFRILQAIPGGILPVITMTILYQIVPPAKIGAASGIYGLGVVVAPAVGPVLGGYLVEYVDWRLIFYINVPIGVLAPSPPSRSSRGSGRRAGPGSTCGASSRSRTGCSPCCWRSPRGRTGGGPATGS